MNASAHVGGTTNNLQWCTCTHIHFADAQLVGVGVFFTLEHVAHHHALGQRAEVFNLFHLKACHRQAFGQLFCGVLHLDEVLKPGEGNPHGAVKSARNPTNLPFAFSTQAREGFVGTIDL